MKVINKSEIKDEKWCVGDVIEFGNTASCTLRRAMIIRRKSQIFDGAATFSTVLLDGPLAGDVMGHEGLKWQKDAGYRCLNDIQDEYQRMWKYAKKVPFYGVVGKPEEMINC